MSPSTLATLVSEARQEKSPAARQVISGWAGIEAVKVGSSEICPFDSAEVDLVAGFNRGVEIGHRQGVAGRPVIDLTPTHLRSYGGPTATNSFAARSAPREEEEDHFAFR